MDEEKLKRRILAMRPEDKNGLLLRLCFNLYGPDLDLDAEFTASTASDVDRVLVEELGLDALRSCSRPA